ncbi:MAG: hypothetical protein V7739_06180 [Motiliproteus sp.]
MLNVVLPYPRSQWWLDDYSRPKTVCALLQVDDLGTITVFDDEGQLHNFTTVREAEVWLTLSGFDRIDDILNSTSASLEPSWGCDDLFNELINGIPTPKIRLVK